MSRRAMIAVACASTVLVFLLLAALAYLWTQRVSLTAELAVATATLTETKEDLASTEATLQETDDALTSTTRTLEDTQDTLDETHADLVQTRTDLNEKILALQETTDDLVAEREKANTLQVELNSTKREVLTLVADKATLTEANNTLKHEQSVLTQEHEHLQSVHTDLKQDHTELQRVNGDITQARGTIRGLQAEIGRLEAQRAPLILRPGVDTRRRGFYCTGSMNPKITCLDEATWLHSYSAADIVVGATISFENSACWAGESGRTAHRVMDIAWRGGIYYFWTKGDANERGDCWVPHTAVGGYIIEIHKNARPANKPLRDGVVAARARLKAAYNAYFAHRRAHGCYNDEEVCWFSDRGAYNTAVRLEAAWKAAWDYYQCWYQNALDSEYPGHIPYRC